MFTKITQEMTPEVRRAWPRPYAGMAEVLRGVLKPVLLRDPRRNPRCWSDAERRSIGRCHGGQVDENCA